MTFWTYRSYYGSGNSCGCNVCANLKSVIAYCKHLIKRNSLASFYSKLLYVNDIALGYFVLFYLLQLIAYIWHLLFIITRQIR